MGGGNDGGSIPVRSEIVKEKPKELRAESDLVGRFRARYCAMTKERLQKPVVMCRLGYLYNYESLLKLLVNKQLPKEFAHVRRVNKNNSDVKQIVLTENPSNDPEFPFICPISQQVYNGRNRFIALWTCGCVFSEKILKWMGLKQKMCPVCNQPYTTADIVILGLSNEDMELKRAILLQEQAEEAAHLKREKERKALESQFQGKIEKKVCTEQSKQPLTKMQQLANSEEDLVKQSQIYKSLFHREYKLDRDLFMRNVRSGLR